MFSILTYFTRREYGHYYLNHTGKKLQTLSASWPSSQKPIFFILGSPSTIFTTSLFMNLIVPFLSQSIKLFTFIPSFLRGKLETKYNFFPIIVLHAFHIEKQTYGSPYQHGFYVSFYFFLKTNMNLFLADFKVCNSSGLMYY